MATVRKASGTLQVTAMLHSAQTTKDGGGGWIIKLKVDGEGAVSLAERARRSANAEVNFEFFEIEEVVDKEDPDQLQLDELHQD